ncbi:hypothetical protein MM221_18045 [Salipaludibacillus sp. LMS25]|jgi:hypothetical protein|uniref:hypothetical protein n=1 Tax=Salipaludibacillus sp. LMS25 TaxID=2924031 RepID=UPI0020CFFD35|nr:hypothetical protein [Salipaludibacillus sp. LMS25]UTR14438.1 hypothetical protein MM221_18045 [Salipaludibacillus sp. LMS25]
MIMQVLNELLFIFLISFSAGTLPAVQVRYPQPLVIVTLGIVLFPLMVGVIVGTALFAWLPVIVLKVSLFLLLIWIVIYLYGIYHPSYGYMPSHSKRHIAFIALLFFILGVEFATGGFSPWLLMLILPLCAGIVIGGFITMARLLGFLKFSAFIHFVPLVLFLFSAIIKLL